MPLQDIWLSSRVPIMNKIEPGPIGNTAGMSKLTLKEINGQARDYIKTGGRWDIAMVLSTVYLMQVGNLIRTSIMIGHSQLDPHTT